MAYSEHLGYSIAYFQFHAKYPSPLPAAAQPRSWLCSAFRDTAQYGVSRQWFWHEIRACCTMYYVLAPSWSDVCFFWSSRCTDGSIETCSVVTPWHRWKEFEMCLLLVQEQTLTA